MYALMPSINRLGSSWLHADLIARLDAIPGVGRVVAEIILAEIGPSVESWPSAKKLASWACVCPGNNESAGKRKVVADEGQKWLSPPSLKRQAASRTRTPISPHSSPYHSILTIVYHHRQARCRL
ncbi:IS110 family transposase [Chloroflexi bacterium TSY]|nr:IS110 family transposase [Chloroflexi bacterium TSY]